MPVGALMTPEHPELMIVRDVNEVLPSRDGLARIEVAHASRSLTNRLRPGKVGVVFSCQRTSSLSPSATNEVRRPVRVQDAATGSVRSVKQRALIDSTVRKVGPSIDGHLQL